MMLLHLLLLLSSISFVVSNTDPASNSYTCSSSQPCKVGCCSKSGYCGFGPDYCGSPNCISNCDRKSDCDPGWGAQWSTVQTCPLNVCCSKYGFCGTTPEFCGSSVVKRPSASGMSSSGRTIGYYEAWAPGRGCDGRVPEDLLAGAYTHLNFAFAYIDPSSFAVAPMDEQDVPLYTRFTGLKQYNPGLQTWISIGGWTFNDPGPTQTTFSDLAASPAAQSKFFASLLSFLSTYGFDGIDLDWEYPVAPERGGRPADYANYVSFLRNLKGALASSGHNYGLTITLPSSYWYLQNFDIVSMSGIVDWFNVMTYDLHGTWDSTDPWIGPYVNAHTNLTEIQQTFDLFWRNNIDPGKLVMGLGFYGRAFTLSNPSCTAPGCPFSSGGDPGECTAESGTLSYGEINRRVAAGATKRLDSAAAVQIVTFGNQWVSFDDATTFQMKIDYANSLGLGGTMVWAGSLDDANNTAARALSGSTGRFAKSLAKVGPISDSLAICRWGDCDGSCPAGLAAAAVGGSGKKLSGIKSGCPKDQQRSYCCPTNDMPTCRWVGGGLNCGASSAGKCTATEVEIATDTSGCIFGHKRLCCTRTGSDASTANCIWRGAAPICSAKPFGGFGCDDGQTQIATSSYGAGGEQPCAPAGGYKSLCCKSPYPQNCAWEYGRTAGFFCNGRCKSGQVPIAADYFNCISGSGLLCCDDPAITNAPSNLNVCYTQDGDVIETNEPDPDDRDPLSILELYWYETECFYPPPSLDGSSTADNLMRIPKRDDLQSEVDSAYVAFDSGLTSWDLPQICDEDDNCQRVSYDDPLLHETIRHFANQSHLTLEPRGNSRKMRICNSQKEQVGTLITARYPPIQKLSRAGVSLATSGVCMAPTVAVGTVKYAKKVVEHVMELQTPKQFIESLLNGKLPRGGTYNNGLRFDPRAMFGDNGYASMTWSQLGITQPAGTTGSTPLQAMFNALGSSADITNLQIMGAKENSIKSAIWGLFKNIVGESKYSKLTAAKKLNIIDMTLAVFKYLNDPAVNKNLKTTFSVIDTIWSAMDGSPRIPTSSSGSSLSDSWRTYVYDFFRAMESNAQSFSRSKINEVLAFWQSNGPDGAAAAGNSQALITYIVSNLQQRLSTLGSDVVVNTDW